MPLPKTDTARYKRDDLTAVTQNWMIVKRISLCVRRICPEPLRIGVKCDMLVAVLLYQGNNKIECIVGNE